MPTARPLDRPTARPSVVFLGTSLTAGLGVDPDQAYPALIQQKADSAGFHLTIENRGNSGETSAGALSRLDWVLQTPPAVLVIETGANDGLRGQDPDSTEANIRAIIRHTRARDSTTRIALVQMEAMPNLGARYVRRFRAIYPTLAREEHVTLVPFLLTGVAGVDSLNQADGIHPTPVGHRIVANTVWRALRPILAEVDRAALRAP
ncbi:MAG TPA: arylesterase [Gemmatimonadales bacterium]|nr:arylesterase [Gemmatimonadales bacterium]